MVVNQGRARMRIPWTPQPVLISLAQAHSVTWFTSETPGRFQPFACVDSQCSGLAKG